MAMLCACSVMSDMLWPYQLWPPRLLCPCNFPDQNTGVGFHFLFQGVFLTQAANRSPTAPALASIFLPQSHLGSSTKYGHKIGIKHKLKSELYTDFCSSHLWATEHSYIKIFPPYDQFYELKFKETT